MIDYISLLPKNATEQELALEAAMARIENVPVPVRDLWNPDKCPVELLPWLAWAFSVDYWNDAWSEQQKRQVIKSSYQVHAKKGTIGALKDALQAVGFDTAVIEWFNENPQADPYTFKIEVQATGRAVEDHVYDEIEKIVEAAKNVRSHLSQITAVAAAEGLPGMSLAAQIGDRITAYPYSVTSLQNSFAEMPRLAEFSVDTVNVYPQ